MLQICNKAPYPANDGSSIAIYNMSRGLIENGVELHLLTINTKKHFKPDAGVPAFFKEQTRYRSVFKNTNTSLPGAFLNLFSSRSYFVSRFLFGEFSRALAETLEKNQFDIVQLEGLFMGVYIPLIRKLSKAKLVLRAHNVEHFIWNRHIANEKRLLRRYYLKLQNTRLKRYELEVLAQVDAVVPISNNDSKAFAELGCKTPMHTCITGVNIAEYRQTPTAAEKQSTVFYFGSMDWLPNQEAVTWFLNNCWEKVHQAVPSARFIVAGRGMPLEFFHFTGPNILIVENVENGRQFYQQHQVMIVPLWSGSGLRIKIIEGMAHGKAIVSTAIGAEGIGYTDGHNIFIANSAELFADRVIELLKNAQLRQRLSENAATHAAENFDNSVVVSHLVEFYRKLAHG